VTTIQRIICTLTILCCCTITDARNLATSNQIIATVDNGIITQRQLNLATNEAHALLKQQQKPAPSANELRKVVLAQLINDSVQLQFAKSHHIEASPEEANQFIQQVAKEHHQSTDNIIQLLTQSGYSKEGAQQKLRDQLLITKTQRMVIAPQITITADQIKALQHQWSRQQASTNYHLMDLRIALPDQANPAQQRAAEQQANKLRSQAISKQTSLQALAKQQPSNSAIHVVDLGTRAATEIPSIFQPGLQLKPGEISQPITANNGIHLLQMVARTGGESMTKQQAYQLAFQRQFEDRLQRWLNDLREQSYIDIKKDA
jgi:peptidyl-prolyl cis-trans isomerase SurA